jgi:hypothetical protein
MGGVTLLHPACLFALLAAAPVLAAYLLKTRRRRVRVSSLRLWREVARESRARRPWQPPPRELSLLLELLAVALTALALARPARPSADAARVRVALVVDTSASMGAVGRWPAALAAARARLADLPSGTEVMLVSADRSANVRSPFTADRRALARALAALEPSECEGDLAAAVRFAADRLRPLPGRRRLVVVTDGALARGGPPADDALPLDLARVGHGADNLALVRLDVRAVTALDGTAVAQVHALVASFAAAPVVATVTVRAADGEATLGELRLTVAPGARAPAAVTFALAPADVGRPLRVTLAPDDALAADNVAFALLPPPPSIPVVLVASEPDPWVARALGADPAARLILAGNTVPTGLPPDALLVLEGLCPAALPPRETLVLAPPAGPCAGLTVLPEVDDPEITSFATTDARWRFLTMDGVHLASARPLALSPAATALVTAGSRVLAADAGFADRTVTVVGLDPVRSDWPLRASFVVFLRNVVELARARRAAGFAPRFRTGDAARVELPPGATPTAALGPDGPIPFTPLPAAAVLGDTTRAGLYRVRSTRGDVVVPINLLSESESDLRDRPLDLAAPTARDAPPLPEPVEYTTLLALLAAVCWIADRLSFARSSR